MTLAERFDRIMTLIDTALDDPCLPSRTGASRSRLVPRGD